MRGPRSLFEAARRVRDDRARMMVCQQDNLGSPSLKRVMRGFEAEIRRCALEPVHLGAAPKLGSSVPAAGFSTALLLSAAPARDPPPAFCPKRPHHPSSLPPSLTTSHNTHRFSSQYNKTKTIACCCVQNRDIKIKEPLQVHASDRSSEEPEFGLLRASTPAKCAWPASGTAKDCRRLGGTANH